MKINEEATVSEEQVLFNKLNWENQQMILRIMRCLQPCELSCEVEEEKKIPEKLIPTSLKGIDNLDEKIEIAHIDTISVIETVNQVLDYLKSKGE